MAAAQAPKDLAGSWEVLPSLLPASPTSAPAPHGGRSASQSPRPPPPTPATPPLSLVLEREKMPPSWRDEYLASLRQAELNKPVNQELVDACSQLADRVATLQAEKAARQPSSPSVDPTTAPGGPKGTDDDDDNTPAAARLRLDLAEALRAKGQAQTRLREAEDELDRLRSRGTTDNRAIRELTAERNALRTKVRDRDEELRGKSKLQQDLQDEMVTLNLQINVLEQQRAKVQAENKQLIERFMRRIGQEAEAMNLANEPHFTKSR